MAKIKVGDVVHLKSGGPNMTAVINDSITGWRCNWFDEQGRLQFGDFPEDALNIGSRGPAPDIQQIIKKADSRS